MIPARLLMIGNSHLVAPRLALQQDPARWPGLHADFFTLPPSALRHIIIRDRTLLPQNAEARGHMMRLNNIPDLPLAGYDGFVVIGGPSFSAVTQLQRRHRCIGFPSVAEGVPCELISTGYMDAMIRHRIRYTAALRLTRRLEKLQQGPVLLVEVVLPSQDCRDDPERLEHYIDMVTRGDAAEFMRRYRDALADVIGPGVTIVRQPSQTIADDFFTASDWMRGSLGLGREEARPHRERDYHHANPAYGALQLDAIVAALKAL
ncbi:hypothetical protein JJJ17_01080 [Paracoccus caeni]|uniref:Uncharacterized protein n=1 Tax=Paracoccus caeni TaxID=657651 RepID=A0A934SCT4_9RHOB|nr:hypothetical protein [Paracoccus caeni]MBK4214511.1 hypothetical protein [Paracoccus caeni]